MALPLGGKFDIIQAQGLAWQSPHYEHDRGGAVDINQIPANRAQIVAGMCLLNGAAFAQAEGTPFNHVHCRWN